MKEFFSSNFQQIKMSNEKTGDSTKTTPRIEDPLSWAKVTRAMDCSDLEEVLEMVHEIQDEKEVVIQTVTLTVAQVAAFARQIDVTVFFDAAAAEDRIDESSEWVLQNIGKGTVTYSFTPGFSAISHRRSDQGVALECELIRKDDSNILPASTSRASKLVTTHTLLQGYSGIRWSILQTDAPTPKPS